MAFDASPAGRVVQMDPEQEKKEAVGRQLSSEPQSQMAVGWANRTEGGGWCGLWAVVGGFQSDH